MLELERWGEGRPLPLVMLAQDVAVGAEDCYEACRRARSVDPFDGLATPTSVPTWLRLYRDHHRVIDVAARTMLGGDWDAKPFGQLVGGAQDLPTTGVDELRDELAQLGPGGMAEVFREGQVLARAAYEQHLECLRADVRDEEYGPETKGDWLAIPEVLFFLHVGFPCWLEYGVPATRLLRRARIEGTTEALEDLLRLDASALWDPQIAQHVHAARQSGRKAVIKRLDAALSGEPLRRLTPAKVKITLGALVYRLFANWDSVTRPAFGPLGMRGATGVKLTAPDVRALFDAAAKDRKGLARDPDLPPADHAFYMALKREVPFWDGLL